MRDCIDGFCAFHDDSNSPNDTVGQTGRAIYTASFGTSVGAT